MAQHKLSLEVSETMNLSILRIEDTSIYSETIPVECPILEVTVPGFRYAVQFGKNVIKPAFRVSLTPCDLELQSTGCIDNPSALPDGIYIIKYSVSPNDVVYVEYNHLRMTKALLNYSKVLCELDVAGCEPNSETAKKLEELRKIKMYLDAAKAKVEVCHEPKKGMEIFTYANKLLSKFSCNSCH